MFNTSTSFLKFKSLIKGNKQKMKENKMTESEKRIDSSIQIENDFEYFSNILESFQNQNHFSCEVELEMWKCRAIIELMNTWNGKNKTFIINALILIMALSNNSYPDYDFYQGMDIAKLSVNDREACASIMESELALY